jgi:hypothetical protein
MARKDITNQVKELTSKYEGGLDVKSADYDEEQGKVVMEVSVNSEGPPSELPPGVEVVSEKSAADTIGKVYDSLTSGYSTASAPRFFLDPLARQDLDLVKPSVLRTEPTKLYSRAIDYYHTKGVYGTAINTLTNLASKGFENDTDDKPLKNFFDNWVIDVGFDETVDNIFFDFFRVGLVVTHKVLGPYKPKINFLTSSPRTRPAPTGSREDSVRRNRFSKNFIPVGYTILNPTLIVVDKSSFFGQSSLYLKPEAGKDIKDLLDKPRASLSVQEKNIVDGLPDKIKQAIVKNDNIPLDPDLVGQVNYRKQPYEKYPLPRGSRAFEALEFKEELRKADYSTLDGITNYILKITVGSDQHPVTSQDILSRVSELFDTTSKSFKVVWNHTLNIEKITSPEVGDILGPDKYTQVNGDITGGLGVIRAIIDGLGDSNAAATDLAVKAIIEEINYARKQISRWIYKEYRSVAEVMGFKRIPKVRFDDMALRDEIQMMSIVQGMIDRRIISYRTGQKKLGFDPETEVAQMKVELPLVEEGILGIVGSPFQQSGRSQNVQQEQRTPRGTPSEGRPRGRPATTKKDDPNEGDVPTRAISSVEDKTDIKEKLLEKVLSLPEEKRQQIYNMLSDSDNGDFEEAVNKPKKRRTAKKKNQGDS